MKKLLSFLLILSLAFVAEQAQAQLLRTVIPTKDSCVNSDNTSIDVSPKTNQAVAFHFKATKVSGTVAGSAKLQGSIDGTNWIDVGSAYTITDVATNVAVFEPTKLSFKYYRIYVATTGTCKIKPIRGYYIERN
jgi:hypothetical protein